MAAYENNDKAPATGVIGTVLGGTALALGAGIFNGGLGGLLGNNSQNMAIQLASKDSEIALLKAGQETDKKLVEVYNALFKNDKEMTAKVDNINSRVLALETAAPLKEQIVDGKFAQVYDKITFCCNSATAAINSSNSAIAALQATVANITKTVVPKDVVCPEYMPRYNSWTAPTT